jgi:predicted RNA-binding protein YlqC (UPF0109 family)
VRDLIEFMAKKLAAHPDEVQVGETPRENDSTTYTLQVNPEDMGRIIGRSGRTAKAMRTLLGSAAAKANVHATLEIVDSPEMADMDTSEVGEDGDGVD